jgi:lipopolysaccharide/colanic/teichoic acid biosynthesis glycosyltransferase
MDTVQEKKQLFEFFPAASLSARWSAVIKRAFDIFVSALGHLFLSPPFGLLAYFIKRESPGPVFYRGPRQVLASSSFWKSPKCRGRSFGL